MAELTRLESKLGEVMGLAMASRVATAKVKRMLAKSERDLSGTLDRLSEEAGETERRCTELVSGLNGKKTAILGKAREVKRDATEMMSTYLDGEDEALDGFEFLTMAEAGEVGHWAIVKTLNQRDGDPALAELAEWALLIQEDHLKAVLESSLALASRQDPRETIE